MIRVLIDAFRRSPRRFALMLLDMGFVNPLLVYQIVIAVLHPSWVSVILILLLAILGHLAINIRVMAWLAVGSQRVVSGCLSKGVSGTTLRVSEVLSRGGYEDAAGIYADMERWLVQFNGMMRRTLDEMISIHYAPGSAVFTAYTQSQFYSSHIFISALPAASSPIQRFFFLHEIAHSIMFIVTRPISSLSAAPAQICFTVWLTFSLPWTLELAGHVLAFLVTVAAWYERAAWSAQTLRASSEIVADALAIIYLNDADLKRLSTSRLLPVLDDKELTPLQNATRRGALREHINMALKGDRDGLIERAMDGFAITGSRFVQGLSMASVVLLAVYAGPPTGGDLWAAVILLALAVALLVVIILMYRVSRGTLVAQLEEKFPVVKPDGAGQTPCA